VKEKDFSLKNFVGKSRDAEEAIRGSNISRNIKKKVLQ